MSCMIPLRVLSRDSPIALTVEQMRGIAEELPEYDGAYDVRPALENQTIPTRGKKMVNDMTVEGIPLAAVSNPFGGVTVTIG